MPDTPRTEAEILVLFADNTAEQISPQDLRDFVVSVPFQADFDALDSNVVKFTNASWVDLTDGGNADVLHTHAAIDFTPPIEIATPETPTATTDGIVRIMGGSTGDRIAFADYQEGLIVQVYPAADWLDAGIPHSAITARLDVPSGATFFPWAIGAEVISNAAVGDAVGVFGASYGAGAAPKWGANFIARDRNIAAAVEAACTIVGIEVNADKFVAGSTAVGVDVVGRGDQALDRGLHIRTDTALGAVGDWLKGLVIEDATIPLKTTADSIHWELFEVGASAPDGRVQIILDSANFRFDISTSGEFVARRTPILINTGATGGDVFIGGSDQTGTSPIIRAGRGDGSAKLGFFSAAPIVKPTGVAVTAAGVHAALVSLGLIGA